MSINSNVEEWFPTNSVAEFPGKWQKIMEENEFENEFFLGYAENVFCTLLSQIKVVSNKSYRGIFSRFCRQAWERGHKKKELYFL